MTPLLLTLTAFAADPAPPEVRRQFREMQLADGRTLQAEILATRAEGMAIAVPQGEIVLSYELLQDMKPIEESAYQAQPPWVSVVAVPTEHRSQITELLDAVPSLVVWTAEGTVGQPAGPLDLAEAELAALRGCGTNAPCVRGAFGQGAQGVWVVTLVPAAEGFVLEGSLSGVDTQNTASVEAPTDQAVWVALHHVLGLEPPKAAPPIRAAAASRRARGGSGGGLGFAPVPGLPALAAGDPGRFGLALAVALPATAAWVAVVGTHAQSAPEHIGLGAAGFYAITVLTNQAFAAGDGAARRPR